MIKNKKDFVVRAILFQSLFCILLFGLLFFLKQSNSELFKAMEIEFSKKLSENITKNEAESVFKAISDKITPPSTDSNKTNNTSIDSTTEKALTDNNPENILENETEFVPFDEPSLNATVEATGGVDIKIASSDEIPENVSLNSYTLTKKMINPVINGKTTSEFGSRIHPISNELTFHAGIDIAADLGTPIYAAFDGKVLIADYDKWNGNYIKIKHENKLMTVYCHCETLNVKNGDNIRAGEVIGYVGSTGSSTGPHLHFELRIDNVSFNPQIALNEALNAV